MVVVVVLRAADGEVCFADGMSSFGIAVFWHSLPLFELDKGADDDTVTLFVVGETTFEALVVCENGGIEAQALVSLALDESENVDGAGRRSADNSLVMALIAANQA